MSINGKGYHLQVLMIVLACTRSTFSLVTSEEMDTKKICVIGSGISGSTFSYFIEQEFNSSASNARIIMIEKGSNIGGRVNSISFHTSKGLKSFELGASIIHGSNLYFKKFTSLLNLTTSRPKKSNNLLGIFDGKSIIYKSSQSSLLTLLSMLWRYGFRDIGRVRRAVLKIAEKFAKFYDIQSISAQQEFTSDSGPDGPLDKGLQSYLSSKAFSTVRELLEEVGLYEYTQMTIYEYLTQVVQLRNDSKFMNEVLVAAIRVNYNQGLHVNALAGAVGIIPVVAPDLFAVNNGDSVVNTDLASVNYGNSEVPRLLVERFVEELHLNHQVISVTAVDMNDTTSLRMSGKVFNSKNEINQCLDNNAQTDLCTEDVETFSIDCDAIVVATPLESAGIQFVGLNRKVSTHSTTEEAPRRSADDSDHREYQHTHTTFVEGQINMSYFSLNSKRGEFPATFLTTNSSALFTSIGTYYVDTVRNTSIYKVFSKQKLNATVLNLLFSSINEVRYKDWEAYPKFKSPEEFSPFQIYPKVFYIHAFENAVSCVECMIVAAKNVAILAAQAFTT